MALDLGELRASVVIDQSQVPGGLASVRRKWAEFTRGMTNDSKRAGADAGNAMGSGVSSSLPRGLSAAQRRVEAFWGRLRSGGGKAGEDAGEGASRGLRSRLTKGVSGLGSVIGGGASLLGKVAAGGALALAGMSAAGVAALGAVGAAGAVVGLKVASGNEQAAISFETMLGSATKADRFLRNLQQFAAETPFEFPELQSAASSLISAGINADKVIPIMRTLGDVTSGMGTGSEGVKRATIALQQMSAAGRITGEDLNQLRDAGIPVFDLLAKATGKSKEEVVKLAQSGKLGKKELGQMMQALESGKGLERFSGLMEKQSQSLAGMWSTLKDTVGQGLAGIMSNALPLLKDGLGQVSGAAARLFGWFNANQDSIGRVFKSGQRALALFGRIVSAVFGAFIKSTGDGTDTVERLADFLDTHQAEMTGVFIALAKFALQGADAMAVLSSGTLRALAFIIEHVFAMRGAIYEMFGGMLSAAAKAFGWVPGLGPKLQHASDMFTEMGRNAKDGSAKLAAGMRSAADGIDNTLRPGLRAAQRELDKLGKTEITKAHLRDAAARAKQLIASIGTEADGSQIKLKRFADISKLAGDRQKALRDRLKDASSGLRSQLTAMEKAGAGQEALTKAWKKGKDRLYEEFKQMGLSNREAKKLAERYAGVKPKVATKFETPGLTKAQKDAKKYKDTTESLKDERNSIVTSLGFSAGKNFNRVVKGKYVNMGEFERGGYTGAGAPDEPAGIVHRDEEVIKSPSRRKFEAKFPGMLKYINRHGDLPPGHADGGTVGQKVTTAFTSRGSAAGLQQAQNHGDDYLNSIANKVSHGMGMDYLREVAEAARAAEKRLAAERAAASGSPGGKVGTRKVGGGWGPIYAAMRAKGARAFNTYPGHHPSAARARDVYPHSWAAANAARALSSVWYVIYRMKIASKNHGNVWRPYHPTNRRGDWRHERHIHVARYDQGGRLRPGWTIAYNGTGKDETVRTHEQEKARRRLALVGGDVHLHTSDKARDAVGELTYALHVIESGGAHA